MTIGSFEIVLFAPERSIFSGKKQTSGIHPAEFSCPKLNKNIILFNYGSETSGTPGGYFDKVNFPLFPFF